MPKDLSATQQMSYARVIPWKHMSHDNFTACAACHADCGRTKTGHLKLTNSALFY